MSDFECEREVGELGRGAGCGCNFHDVGVAITQFLQFLHVLAGHVGGRFDALQAEFEARAMFAFARWRGWRICSANRCSKN